METYLNIIKAIENFFRNYKNEILGVGSMVVFGVITLIIVYKIYYKEYK